MADVTGYTLPGHDETYMYADGKVRKSGYGGPCVSFYHTGDSSIAEFEAALDAVIAEMADKEAKQICFTCTGIASTTFYGTVYRHTDKYVIVTGTTYYRNGSVVKCKFNGTWEAHAWDNPPMELGVEYRTTERWNGKAVYTTLVNLGYGPNSGTYDINTGITATEVFRTTGRIGGGGSIQSIPYENNSQVVSISGFANSAYTLFASLKTNFDASSKVVWAQFWYIKE